MNNFTFEIGSKSPSIKNEQVLIRVNNNKSVEDYLYKFMVGNDGKWETLRGYERNNEIQWMPTRIGNYIIMVQIKDCKSIKPFDFILKEVFEVSDEINKQNGEEPNDKNMTTKEEKNSVQIEAENIKKNETNNMEDNLRIEKININKMIDNGKVNFLDLEIIPNIEGDFLYKFIIDNNKEKDVMGYSDSSFISFSPDDIVSYKIETFIKKGKEKMAYEDKAFSNVYIDDKNGKYIDYTIMNIKDYYRIGDDIIIDFNFSSKNIDDYKYLIKIDDIKIEESNFTNNSRLHIKPKSSGVYTIYIGKNNVVEEENKPMYGIVKFKVNSLNPVKIKEVVLDKKEVYINDFVTISVEAEGGKYILFEFYMKINEKWEKVQKYSKKNFFTFMPVEKKKYNLFIVARSNTSQDEYDDHYKLDINVLDENSNCS
ncbi:triple tyrosine motif-containing protein [Clostridium sp. DL1XJH146]